MKNQLKQLKVCGFSQFSKSKLKEVKKFISQGRRWEGYEPIYYWGSIENRKNPGVNEILCYNHENILIGFLALYHFEEFEVEINAYVHPDHRSDWVYRSLWEELKRVISKVPFEIKRYMFTCNQENLGLKDYITRLGSSCIGFTHKLGLTNTQFQKKNLPLISEFEFRAEMDAETPAIFVLYDEEIVGSVYLQIEKEIGYLYDYWVDRSQGSEFEQKVLVGFLNVIFNQLKFKKIWVDVNDALNLSKFKNGGFKVLATYEHWTLPFFIDPLKQREKQLEELILNFQCYQVQDQLTFTDYKH